MSRYSLNYAQVAEMVGRQPSRVIHLNAAGFVILIDVIWELSFRNNWNNDGVALTDNEWDIVANWLSEVSTALLTDYECEDYPPWEAGDVTYAIVRDEKSDGTNGGGCAAGAWQQRDINVELYDPDSIVGIAANQFTPVEGDYRIAVKAPQNQAGSGRLRLWNVTGAALVEEGQNAACPVGNAANQTHATLDLLFSADGSDAYRIDHWTNLANAGDGFGRNVNNGSDEVYTSIVLEQR